MTSDEEIDDGNRTITLGKIVSYGLGILIILIGLASLAQGLGGLLIILAGVFALPPVRRRITGRIGISFSRWVVVLTVVVLIGAGGASLSPLDGSEQVATSGEGVPTSTATPAQQSLNYELNESFTVGSGDQSIQYRVIDAFGQESVGSSSIGTDADGIYLIVILELENVGDESFDISDRQLRAVDDQDREYEADFSAAAYADSDPRIGVEGITYDQLNPGLTTTRAVVFDVNPGAEYQLKIEPVGVFSSADENYVQLGEVVADSR
jgi:hypothetical protein